MTPVHARIMFALTLVLLVPTLAFLFFSSRPPSDSHRVVAQFEDAFPLVEGMNVRVDGAIVGSVGKISVNDDGLAEVTLLLDDETTGPVRADASAAIRQQDTTGDSYVAFETGHSTKALAKVDGVPTIVCKGGAAGTCPRTLVAPRLDDVLSAFGPSERAGIQLTLSELALALDRRGDDINEAALSLRPGLVAADTALREVDTQNAALRKVIDDGDAVTAQAASRRASLGRLIDSLASTLRTTSARTGALDAGLRRLPATTARARTTLDKVRTTAVATRPLAQELRTVAPPLAAALGRAPEFLPNLSAFLVRTRSTLGLTEKLIKAGTPTIEADPTRVVTGPFDLAPAISNLLRGVLGEDETIEVLFNEKYGLGPVASEPGNQGGYPDSYADRRFMRTSAILNCEGFGIKIRPGCLLDQLGLLRAQDEKAAREASTRDRGAGAGQPGRATPVDGRSADPAPAKPAPGAAPAPAPAPQGAPQAATPAQPQPAPAQPAPAPSSPPPSGDPVNNLLDWLFR